MYSYDVHGNVDTLVQDFGNRFLKPNPMNQSGNQIKRIEYNYDLISGKVNQVSYQPDSSDAYYHRYQYDGENRLVNVYTGRDSVMLFFFPERDASYIYYKHGPLAQTELGQLRVQKMDYVYTLQGWIKAVNPVMGGTLANGNDSTEAYPVAQDVFGYGLNYFKNDYKAIGYSPATTGLLAALTTNANPLYNGNISAMVVNIPQLGSPKVYAYKYDQLNRLVAMDAYNGLNVNNGIFTPIGINDYRERVSYDANGNILTYQRNGDAARISMDNMSYYYKANTNQLHKVTDAASDAASVDYSKYNDLKQGQTDNNYQYDQIGNLVSDASDTLTSITWNVYGKIQSISKAGQQIRYVYDASGNRILKYTSTDTTVYVRDATGNVLSVYTRTTSSTLKQTETHLYGIARLGIKSQQSVADSLVSLNSNFGSYGRRIFIRGEKNFEVTNHLGNVLVQLLDRRIGNDANNDDIIEQFNADIVAANDYLPFGMLMPSRNYSSRLMNYRFGNNGQERSIELGANLYHAQYWEYDSRLGRRWNIDPVVKVWESGYSVFSNDPINLVDPIGLDSKDPQTHRVKKGETLSSIARQYSTTVDVLARLNGIKDIDKIQVGRSLKLPKYYDPNEIDESTGIKTEIIQKVKFYDVNLGFSEKEVNRFDYKVSLSDREYSPNGSGVATVIKRFDDFLNGKGYTNVVFGPETEFAKSARNHYSIEKAREFFYSKFSNLFANSKSSIDFHISKSNFGLLAMQGQAMATEIKGKWGPEDIGKTGWDGPHDWGMQFIGSCGISIFASYDANRLIFVVANSTSGYSAMGHVSEKVNISRSSNIGGPRMSTILNIVVWDEPIDYNRFKRK